MDKLVLVVQLAFFECVACSVANADGFVDKQNWLKLVRLMAHRQKLEVEAQLYSLRYY